MSDTIIRGTPQRWTAVFSIAPNDNTVRFVVRKPDGTETTYRHGTDAEVVKDTPTQYHLDTPCDSEKTWVVRCYVPDGSPGASADEDQVFVKSRFNT